MADKDFLEDLKGHAVTIAFLDGKSIVGILVDYSIYTLLIKQKEIQVIIPKHAVKYLHEAKTETKTPVSIG